MQDQGSSEQLWLSHFYRSGSLNRAPMARWSEPHVASGIGGKFALHAISYQPLVRFSMLSPVAGCVRHLKDRLHLYVLSAPYVVDTTCTFNLSTLSWAMRLSYQQRIRSWSCTWAAPALLQCRHSVMSGDCLPVNCVRVVRGKKGF